MRVSAVFFIPLLAAAHKHNKGPEIWGSHNCIDECDMHQAIYCLQENICSKGDIPEHGKARCTIGKSTAYICDYRGKHDKEHGCDVHSIYRAWDMIRVHQNSSTGWVHDGEITYGFDERCKHNECDNGWKQGSEGDHCSNLRDHKKPGPWLCDFEAESCPGYKGYTDKYEHAPAILGDKSDVEYAKQWQQGKRPT